MSPLVKMTIFCTGNLLVHKGEVGEKWIKGDWFLDVYGKYKSLDDNNSRSYGKYAVINTSIRLGVPISQEIINKYCRPKKRLIPG